MLRQQLLPVIPFPVDYKMQTRLVSALFQWLRSGYDPIQPCDDVPLVNNFQFAEGYQNDSISACNLTDEKIVKANALMPNPTTGKFTITLFQGLKNGKVILLDANGKIIESRKENCYTITFDISARLSGGYFVRIENEEKVFTFKVIKQ